MWTTLSAVLLVTCAICTAWQDSRRTERPRARDLGIVIGKLPTGKHNAITDVAGVTVGHATCIEGDAIRTGVTVVLPHPGNPYLEKVPAAIVVGNGYGKLAGITQVNELGELESPIALTNTLNVGLVADALVGWMLAREGMEQVRSLNVVVGETNDGRLNDIRGRHVREKHVRAALDAATTGAVPEGSVGAGTGTRCFAFKGGVGTASRRVMGYTVGVLVQTNFGGSLKIDGRSVPPAILAERKGAPRKTPDDEDGEHGSCMIVIATDAPLEHRNLTRLATRSFAGMARTGASFSNGSGDYAIAFSTAKELRRKARARTKTDGAATVRNDRMTALFVAVAEATEEAILNSMFRATTVESRFGRARALPVEALRTWWRGRK